MYESKNVVPLLWDTMSTLNPKDEEELSGRKGLGPCRAGEKAGSLGRGSDVSKGNAFEYSWSEASAGS